jgi:hypothetical protein
MKPVLAACLALLACLAPAQDKEKLPPINPDRPDFTDGPGITPLGKWLLEMGYRQTHSTGATLQEFGDQPTVRLGLRENFELRFTLPAYALAGPDKGFEDAAVGFKLLLRDGGDGKGWKSPSFAIEAGASVPSGSRAFRSSRFEPSAVGIVDWDFGAGGELGGNIGVTAQEDFAFWSASLSYDRSLTKRATAFLESYALFPGSAGGPDDHFADTGVQYLLNDNCMLDAFAGCQLDRHRQTAFFGAGVSLKF